MDRPSRRRDAELVWSCSLAEQGAWAWAGASAHPGLGRVGRGRVGLLTGVVGGTVVAGLAGWLGDG